MWTFRRIFWFEQGEAREIAAKLAALKWDDTFCEANVMATLVLGLAFAFLASWWYGLLFLWGVKEAVQALNMKGFFDRLQGGNLEGTCPAEARAIEMRPHLVAMPACLDTRTEWIAWRSRSNI